MAFSIAFEVHAATAESARGFLEIEDSKEYFEAGFLFWSREQYEQHRLNAGRRVLDGSPACFIVSIDEPSSDVVVECWPAWPRGDHVEFQNWVIPPNKRRQLDLSVPEALFFEDDGGEASRWLVTLEDLRAWVQRGTP